MGVMTLGRKGRKMAHQATAILDMVGPLLFGDRGRPERHCMPSGKAHSYGGGSCIGWFESAHYDTLTQMNIASKHIGLKTTLSIIAEPGCCLKGPVLLLQICPP